MSTPAFDYSIAFMCLRFPMSAKASVILDPHNSIAIAPIVFGALGKGGCLRIYTATMARSMSKIAKLVMVDDRK
jgi:hypothetical protein